MKDDAISRRAAIEAVSHGCQEWRGIFGRCEENILALPSAQPEIIRCRDCKYNDMPPTAGNAGCTLLYGMTNQNGFCSLAERREEAEQIESSED